MNVLDLFSGIGGFSLGLERAGFRTIAFCEIEPYCRAVLAKHWPGVPIHPDIARLRGADVGAVDVICGGFPCQDISLAGRGAGLEGKRSGLWSEYKRVISEVRPRFVIIENSPALRTRGADRILSELEEMGYACEPFVVGAMHAGAWHRRNRAWLIAHAHRQQHEIGPSENQGPGTAELPSDADRAIIRNEQGRCCRSDWASTPFLGDYGARGDASYSDGAGLEIVLDGHARQLSPAVRAHAWSSEPDVVRVVYGVPARTHRIKALGNAVVPQVAEAIGRAIKASI